ncbi:MAG TPA: hypothetical protein DEA47_00825 [Peptococcaceae bacterium]|nr:MAG: O-antigen polymerase [Clostridia bacterium 41_269]HBT19910.1 hypothetical protein [Peptococcaceae bacterium]
MAKKKKVKFRKEKEREREKNNLLFYLTFWGLGLILFYPPYFRGLFFKGEQQWTLFLAGIVFLLCWMWKASRKDYALFANIFELLAFCMLVSYIISCFNAADLGLAVAEIVKMSIYFIVFWCTSQLSVKEDIPDKLAAVLYASGVGVALAGFLTAVDVVYIKDGFVGNRIYSTLQYPNALAIYMAAVIFLGFYFWHRADDRLKLVITPCNFLLMMIFFSAGSRGGFLVLPIMMLLYFVGLPREHKIKWVLYVLFISVLGLFISGKVIPAAAQDKYSVSWIWFIVGITVSLAVQFSAQRLSSRGGQKEILSFDGAASKKKLLIVGSAVLAAAVLLAFLLVFNQPAVEGSKINAADADNKGILYRILPENIASRISDISLKTHNAQTRIFWTFEALDLVKNSPLIGMGGGAWEAAYKKFQDYDYSTTQVHNHFFQLWAEVGTLGLIIYAAVWIMFLITAYKNYRHSSGLPKLLNLSIIVSAVGLGLHSFIDFDLALGAVSIFLWTAFGFASGISKKLSATEQEGIKSMIFGEKFLGKQDRRTFFAAASLLTLFFVVLPIMLIAAADYAKSAVIYLQQGRDADRAFEYFKKASILDPFSSDYRANMASIKLALGDPKAAEEYMKQAIKRSPYDAGYYGFLSSIYKEQKDWEKSIAAAKKMEELAPWVPSTYEGIARAYVSAGLGLMEEGKKDKAEQYFKECAYIPVILKERVENLPPKIHEIWRAAEKQEFLNLTPAANLNFGISQCILGNDEEASAFLNQALSDTNIQQEAHLWLAVLAAKNGDQKAADEHLKQVKDKELIDNFEKYKNYSL